MKHEVLALEGYKPAKGLLPIGPQLEALLILHPGERVAFREDHAEFGSGAQPSDDGSLVPPTIGDGESPRRAQYGVIQAIGYCDGEVMMDVLVFDPHHGVSEDGEIRRIGMEDIQ